MTDLADTGHLVIGDARIEYRMIGPRPDTAPTIVMLHEGLGSVTTWGDFPQKVAERTGAGVFVYSRAGYGKSSTVTLPRPLDYMQREATDVLPKLLDAIGFRRGILLGHSDGATISAWYGGSVQDHRVRGIILMAPHFFMEPSNIEAIRNTITTYETTDLRVRLARHHADVDTAFRGWSGAWLDPGFENFDTTEALA
jgi:pimeloyl-ACP methyl ester carboxylesterase